jgi:AcrR family transcriptional regulator
MVEAILTATARVLVDRGWEGLSTNRVAKRAGVSVGSLYQYFPNKEALCAELSRRHLDRMVKRLAKVTCEAADMPLAAGIEHVVDVLFAVHSRNIALHRELVVRAPSLGLQDARERYEERVTRLVRVLLMTRRDELRADADLDLSAWLIVRQTIAVIERFVTDPIAAVVRDALRREVTLNITRYLAR